MKPASFLSILVLSVVAFGHLLRLITRTEVLIGGASVPMWSSVVGLVVAGSLAVALWRETRRVAGSSA